MLTSKRFWRDFNGKTFGRYMFAKTKEEAEETGQRLKDSFCYRIIKTSEGFDILRYPRYKCKI